MSDLVTPGLSRGLRDQLPDHMQARQWMLSKVRGVYELYGFVPLQTPAFEFLDVLSGTGGDEAQQSIFHVDNPREPEERGLGLRFDLTVPLARVVSQYVDLPRPFRRYQVSPVWRADKPGPGRYREFTQFDLDSVGAPSEVADTEIIAGMCDTLSALDVDNYVVRFSSRSVLNLLLDFAGISRDRSTDVFRVLDKLEKIGPAKVRLELTTGYKDESGDQIPGLGLTSEQVDRIELFLAIRSDERGEVIAQLRDLFSGLAQAGAEIDVIDRISGHLAALGYGNDRVVVDLSIARGLAYYTGPVFEAYLRDAPRFGSVFGGGRYDELVQRFTGEAIPATGASMGVDRLLAALVDIGAVKLKWSTAQVLVINMDESLTSDYLEMTYELRRAGIRTELYLGTERGIGKQLKYADRCDIPVAVIYGTREKESGQVQIKDMDVGRRSAEELKDRADWIKERPGQFEAPRAELVSRLGALLGRIESGL